MPEQDPYCVLILRSGRRIRLDHPWDVERQVYNAPSELVSTAKSRKLTAHHGEFVVGQRRSRRQLLSQLLEQLSVTTVALIAQPNRFFVPPKARDWVLYQLIVFIQDLGTGIGNRFARDHVATKSFRLQHPATKAPLVVSQLSLLLLWKQHLGEIKGVHGVAIESFHAKVDHQVGCPDAIEYLPPLLDTRLGYGDGWRQEEDRNCEPTLFRCNRRSHDAGSSHARSITFLMAIIRCKPEQATRPAAGTSVARIAFFCEQSAPSFVGQLRCSGHHEGDLGPAYLYKASP